MRKRCNVELIPNFVSEGELLDDQREYKEQITDLIYTGGVIAEKGCDVIIRTAECFPEIKFHLIGSIDCKIKKMNIPANVVLYGNKDKIFVQQMLRYCDAFLFLTSYWGEGFSNSLVEAMSAGLPCIVSDWAANADMIGSEGGIVIKDKITEETLSASIHKIAKKEVRARMGIRNANKARKDYSESIIIPKYTLFYDNLIKGVEHK